MCRFVSLYLFVGKCSCLSDQQPVRNRSTFMRTTVVTVNRHHRTDSTRHRNDLRASIPMQIFTRLNYVRLLILGRHFRSLWEERRPSPFVAHCRRPSASLARRPSKYRCSIHTYVTSARKLNYVRKARTEQRHSTLWP